VAACADGAIEETLTSREKTRNLVKQNRNVREGRL
jgi:hypothetical protein